jgi:uncharacterized protein
VAILRHREERSDVAIQRRVLDCFAALAMTVALLFAAPAAAQTFPKLTGRVVDQANLLTQAQEAELTSKSEALEKKTGRQFVVATVNTLEGHSIEDYGYKLGRTWAIGQKDKDDGVILLVAPNERKVRVETGYGATVFLTDAMSSIIIRRAIVPRFKAGDMAGGIMAGADEIIKTMQLSPEEAAKFNQQAQAQQKQQQRSGGGPGGIFPFIVIAGLFFLFMAMAAGRRRAGRRYRSRGGGGIDPWVVLWGLNELSRASRHSGWGGGGDGGGGFGGGGGFSGGGGSFGGGGASGSW